MKVVILLGRGIEGCGVTKYTIEQCKWLDKTGYADYEVFASSDKSWSRKTSHDISKMKLVKFAKKDQVDTVIKACNEADLVIINSLPSSSHPEASIEQFTRLVNELKKPMALIQHDHSIHSIRRNAVLDESIKKAKVIFTHSVNSDFAEYCRKVLPTNSLFDDDCAPIINFQPGIDFDSVRDKFWKPITEQDSKAHKWIGRTTIWKGYDKYFNLASTKLTPGGHLVTLEGIDRSPAYISFKQEGYDYIDCLDQNIAEFDMSNQYGTKALLFGTFVNEEMLERMSRVAFGYQLTLLKPHFLERSMEYTHCEVVCAGTVPVFDRTFGNLVKHRETGLPLSTTNSAIWLSADTQQAWERIQELQDPVLRDKTREEAYEFFRSHQDAQYTFAELFEHIENNI